MLRDFTWTEKYEEAMSDEHPLLLFCKIYSSTYFSIKIFVRGHNARTQKNVNILRKMVYMSSHTKDICKIEKNMLVIFLTYVKGLQ